MIEELKKDLLHFLADNYFNEDWQNETGDGEFNKLITNDEYKIPLFSLGNLQGIPNSFLLVQGKSLNIDLSLLPNLGAVDFGYNVTLNIYIETVVNSQNASIISDKYIDAISKCIQIFSYNYKGLSLVNPKASIRKYYKSSGEGIVDFNTVTSLIVDVDFNFSTKTSELTNTP